MVGQASFGLILSKRSLCYSFIWVLPPESPSHQVWHKHLGIPVWLVDYEVPLVEGLRKVLCPSSMTLPRGLAFTPVIPGTQQWVQHTATSSWSSATGLRMPIIILYFARIDKIISICHRIPHAVSLDREARYRWEGCLASTLPEKRKPAGFRSSFKRVFGYTGQTISFLLSLFP